MGEEEEEGKTHMKRLYLKPSVQNARLLPVIIACCSHVTALEPVDCLDRLRVGWPYRFFHLPRVVCHQVYNAY